jgi:hypothetical protein
MILFEGARKVEDCLLAFMENGHIGAAFLEYVLPEGSGVRPPDDDRNLLPGAPDHVNYFIGIRRRQGSDRYAYGIGIREEAFQEVMVVPGELAVACEDAVAFPL